MQRRKNAIQCHLVIHAAVQGRVGTIMHQEKHKGSFNIVLVRDSAGNEFATRYATQLLPCHSLLFERTHSQQLVFHISSPLGFLFLSCLSSDGYWRYEQFVISKQVVIRLLPGVRTFLPDPMQEWLCNAICADLS